jgi:hypothetical protein
MLTVKQTAPVAAEEQAAKNNHVELLYGCAINALCNLL